MIQKTLSVLLTAGILSIAANTAIGQSWTYENLEKKQDKIESTYVKVYGILEAYPEASYTFEAEDGVITAVNVRGIDYRQDAEELERYLMSIERMKSDIRNLRNRLGIYYIAETQPMPAEGYDEFFGDLYKAIEYPESAQNAGVEGTVIVKFVVDAQGNVQYATASDLVNSDADWIVDDMKNSAVAAVEGTSGEWLAATTNGEPVPHYVSIPVQFVIENEYYKPVYPAF